MSVTVVDPGFRRTGDVLCQKQGLVRAGVDKGGELGVPLSGRKMIFF